MKQKKLIMVFLAVSVTISYTACQKTESSVTEMKKIDYSTVSVLNFESTWTQDGCMAPQSDCIWKVDDVSQPFFPSSFGTGTETYDLDGEVITTYPQTGDFYSKMTVAQFVDNVLEYMNGYEETGSMTTEEKLVYLLGVDMSTATNMLSAGKGIIVVSQNNQTDYALLVGTFSSLTISSGYDFAID